MFNPEAAGRNMSELVLKFDPFQQEWPEAFERRYASNQARELRSSGVFVQFQTERAAFHPCITPEVGI